MSLRLEWRSGVAIALLDRPERLNALDLRTVGELRQAVDQKQAVLVVGSTSPRSFSSGADTSVSDAERAAVSESLYGLYAAMRASATIIITAADGHAIGGGAQLLLASDIRVAGHALSMRFVGIGHGLVVGAWGLPRLIGRGRALELCLTTRPIDADEAFAMGLVERVVDDPLAEAIELGTAISSLDPALIAAAKTIVGMDDASEALQAERSLNSAWRGSIPASERS
jgi:enoyl-CoA hydratase/carnithine racemase